MSCSIVECDASSSVRSTWEKWQATTLKCSGNKKRKYEQSYQTILVATSYVSLMLTPLIFIISSSLILFSYSLRPQIFFLTHANNKNMSICGNLHLLQLHENTNIYEKYLIIWAYFSHPYMTVQYSPNTLYTLAIIK